MKILQPRFERAPPRGLPLDEVGALGGIGGQVVQLGNRQLDVFLPSGDDAGERGPTAIEHRGHCFEVRGDGAVFGLRRSRQQRPSMERGQRIDLQGIQKRRRDVDEADRPVFHRVSAFRVGGLRISRPVGAELRDDQRHVQRGLVREETVGQLAVFPESLAVIRRQDHERRTRPARRATEQRSERGIRVGHLAVIRTVRVLAIERRRWRVRRCPRRTRPRRRCRRGGRSGGGS